MKGRYGKKRYMKAARQATALSNETQISSKPLWLMYSADVFG
ncbi:hypothetical protein [Alteromonas sp. MMG017]|nr:hypothetical protein [Alteromonas sp. MMG017]